MTESPSVEKVAFFNRLAGVCSRLSDRLMFKPPKLASPPAKPPERLPSAPPKLPDPPRVERELVAVPRSPDTLESLQLRRGASSIAEGLKEIQEHGKAHTPEQREAVSARWGYVARLQTLADEREITESRTIMVERNVLRHKGGEIER